jgi:hypothetical protein
MIPQGYFWGGGGYVLSRGALEIFVTQVNILKKTFLDEETVSKKKSVKNRMLNT